MDYSCFRTFYEFSCGHRIVAVVVSVLKIENIKKAI